MNNKRGILIRLFDTAVRCADPYQTLQRHFPREKPKGRTLVIAIGKGGGQMALAFETLWQEAGFGAPDDGLIVTNYGQEVRCKNFEVIYAAHPVPDENSLTAGHKIRQMLSNLRSDDLLIALISGGGSSLLSVPASDLTLRDKQDLNLALLTSGAPIHVMNAIRQQASLIKGGRLAHLAHPARVISYIISDVAGDNPALVASGPTIEPQQMDDDVLALIRYYQIPLTERLKIFFTKTARTQPKNAIIDRSDFSRDEVYLVASSRLSLLGAQRQARSDGINAVILSDSIEGQARDIAAMHGALARQISLYNQPFERPVLLLSGGETSVTFNKHVNETIGQGGRNSEFALALAITIARAFLPSLGSGECSNSLFLPQFLSENRFTLFGNCSKQGNITALSADTDGIDGNSASAGAFCDEHTVAKLHLLGLNPIEYLYRHDSASAFKALGDLFTPGITGTNVNDFRAILIT